MSNQNLNTLNVKILNYTGDHIYHRGRPIHSFPLDPSGTNSLCLDRLGVGPTQPCPNPLYNLDVSGVTRIIGHISDASSQGNLGQVITATTDGWTWTDVSGTAGTNLWTLNGTDIYYNGGDVGIGTSNPSTTLDVSGNVLIQGTLDMSCNHIIDVSGISFCPNGGGIDLSCNPIRDVSGIYFCDGSSFTHGNSLDISASTVHIVNTNLIVDDNVSIGTTDTSGGLFILKPQHLHDYGPATFPPNLYLKANTTSNSTAVLKFSARYAGMYQCEPAYIWQGYRVGSSGGSGPDPDTSEGRLCITANGYTSFILDGHNGYVGIGNRGQVLQSGTGDVTLIPTQPLDVSGNTLIRGDLQVGIGNENRQLTLRCAASGTGNPNDASRNGLIIWDGPSSLQQGGLFTALDTNTNRSIFEFGLSYNQDGVGNIIDVSNIIVLDSSGGGRVGIGTYEPLQTLDVSGNTRLRGALYDTANSSGGVGQVLTSTGTGTNWAAAGGGGSGLWTSDTSGTIYYDISGDLTKVGIGTNLPTAMLDVSGNVKIRGFLDMSCNRIIDVSGIYFCDASGSSITGGNSLDISSNIVYFKNKGGQIPITVDISGNTRLRGALYDTANGPGTSGQVLSSTGTGTDWIDAGGGGGGGLWSSGGLGSIYYDGSGGSGPKVGIGTTSPATALDVSGVLTVHDGTIDMSGDNLAIGNLVFDMSIPGTKNTAVGQGALHMNFGGTENTAMGYAALENNESGNYNTAMGSTALFANEDGTHNTAVGYQALEDNRGGTGNTAVGSQSLLDNIDASYNTAFGMGALSANTNGPKNTAVGYLALTTNIDASCNTAVGYKALNANTTGNHNVAIGYHSLLSTTLASDNVAIGSSALEMGEHGRNIAIGSSALKANVNGSSNVAIGYQAMLQNNPSSAGTGQCVAIGSFALANNTTGMENIAIGEQSQNQQQFGRGNTSIGWMSLVGDSTFTGSYNTAIGYQAGGFPGDPPVTGLDGSNNTFLGNGAYLAGTMGITSNTIILGNSSITDLRCADTSISGLSDARDKKDIIDIPYGLDLINNLQPRQFTWNMRGETDSNPNQGTTRVGFIAQELQTVLGEDNTVLNMVNNHNPNKLTASYGQLVPVLTKAIQELTYKLAAMEARLTAAGL